VKKTHLSLYYLAGYLLPAGLALVLVPKFAMTLLFSNRAEAYGDILPRLLGGTLIALGILIVQIIRHRLEILYPTTLAVRAVLLTIMLGLYLYSRDPFFISLMVIVGFGVLLTGMSYFLDRQGK
jgi:hypothetical protein